MADSIPETIVSPDYPVLLQKDHGGSTLVAGSDRAARTAQEVTAGVDR